MSHSYREIGGVLLIGAGLFPLLHAVEHGGERGTWLMGVLTAPLLVWGLLRFVADWRRPLVRIGPQGVRVRATLRRPAAELRWDEIESVRSRPGRIRLQRAEAGPVAVRTWLLDPFTRRALLAAMRAGSSDRAAGDS
ncbi:MAG: PH domain-containing protein [Deltaproteobacteria bacterium]|nr:PH domain-containing protein [Deltaproteobacteria bacterium]